MERVYQQVWIDLPKTTRQHLVKVFGLIPNGIAEIRDQTVISDGYTNDDLRRITSDKMAEYVGSVESFSRLWELTLSKVKSELNPPIDLADLTEEPIVNDVVPETIVEPTPVPTKFCDFCDSKGQRHKATCTKPGVINGFEKKQ